MQIGQKVLKKLFSKEPVQIIMEEKSQQKKNKACIWKRKTLTCKSINNEIVNSLIFNFKHKRSNFPLQIVGTCMFEGTAIKYNTPP